MTSNASKHTFFVVTYDANNEADYKFFEDRKEAENLFDEWSDSRWFADIAEDDPDASVILYEATYDTAEPWAADDWWTWWDEPGDHVAVKTYKACES